MRVFQAIVIAVGVLIVLAIAISFCLPNRFSVRRTRLISADPNLIYSRFATPKSWASWSTWSTQGDSTMRYTFSGPDSGVGATMAWTSKKFGDGHLAIAAADPGREVRYELRMGGTDMRVHGQVNFEPAAGGTRVTWHDQGDFGANPLWRLFTPMMDGMLGGSFERSLDHLAASLKQG
jgi:uncharacterized protein YndB with AHSA1/START domain